jgi:hypothetical protein
VSAGAGHERGRALSPGPWLAEVWSGELVV